METIAIVAGLAVFAYSCFTGPHATGPHAGGTATRRNYTNTAHAYQFTYRARNARTDNYYVFQITPMGANNYRAYITRSPSYGARNTGASVTHRLTDGNRKYICWNSNIPTAGQCEAVCRLWADSTQQYIERGVTFG